MRRLKRRLLSIAAVGACLFCLVYSLRLSTLAPAPLPFRTTSPPRSTTPQTSTRQVTTKARTTTSTKSPSTNPTTSKAPPKQEPALPLEPSESAKEAEKARANSNVHAFYYPWYGSPQFDNGSWIHWNHPYLAHWNKAEALKWPMGVHKPPDDIGANFYPQLGAYSSRDLGVIDQHMRWALEAGIGVLAVSWYPPGRGDDNGRSWEDLMPSLLDAAQRHGLRITFHLEPYKERSAASLKEDLDYIARRYSAHSALYRHEHMGESRPLLYVYDSYLLPNEEWRSLLHPEGVLTIRRTSADVFLLGLLVKEAERTGMLKAGFDGFYTYFAADGFTYGSSQQNWPSLSAFARKNRLIFSPSVGPGYIDVRVRPWNKVNTRARHNGSYYAAGWEAAIGCRAPLVSLTSFNEWHEGTQIEPAVAKEAGDGFRYQNYLPMSPLFYLQQTRRHVTAFENRERKDLMADRANLAAAAMP